MLLSRTKPTYQFCDKIADGREATQQTMLVLFFGSGAEADAALQGYGFREKELINRLDDCGDLLTLFLLPARDVPIARARSLCVASTSRTFTNAA